jgi:hypothetical protein
MKPALNPDVPLYKFVPRVWNNLVFYLAYGLSWLFWQLGAKQVRRAFMMSYDDIEQRDVISSLRDEVEEDRQLPPHCQMCGTTKVDARLDKVVGQSGHVCQKCLPEFVGAGIGEEQA